MTKEKQNIVKKYLKDISHNLNCGLAFKSVFMQTTKQKITEYTDNKDSFTIDDLYAEFGTPEEVVSDLLDKDECAELLKKAKKRTVLWMIISVVLLVILILATALIIKMLDTYGGTGYISNIESIS